MGSAPRLKEIRLIVITGASSGIGAAYLRTLGKIGSAPVVCNLSRTEPENFEGLGALHHFPVDLQDPAAIAAVAGPLRAVLEAAPDGPMLLINNSGFGHYGVFGESREAELGMIDLNVRAVVDLTERLLPMLRARTGWIVNVASLAGWQPTPYMATYAATKAFVLHWSAALNEELRASGIRTLAVCPGPTESQFFRRAGFAESPGTTVGQTAEAVVAETFAALERGRSVVVTGWRHRLVALAGHFLSKAAIARVAARVIRRQRLDRLKARAP